MLFLSFNILFISSNPSRVMGSIETKYTEIKKHKPGANAIIYRIAETADCGCAVALFSIYPKKARKADASAIADAEATLYKNVVMP